MAAPGRLARAPWLRFAWAGVWVGAALFRALPGQNSGTAIASALTGGIDGTPAWLASSEGFEHANDRFWRRHRGDLVGHSARLHSELVLVEEPAGRVPDARGVNFIGTDGESRARAGDGRSVEELVGGLGQAQQRDAQGERGKHSPGAGVGGHDVAGGEEQRLRDLALDDDARRLRAERCRISVRPDGDDKPDAEVLDPG